MLSIRAAAQPSCRAVAKALPAAGGAPSSRALAASVRLLLELLERQRGRDMREVSQALGEVSQHLPPLRLEFLRKQAEVVRATACPLEGLPCLLSPPLVRQTLRQPERAGDKRPFVASQPVPGRVPQHQPVMRQFLTDRLRRADHPLVVPSDEVDRRQQQQRRIQILAAVAADENTS